MYAAARMLGMGRRGIVERIRRLQRTLVALRDGEWEVLIFGPTLHSVRSGVYVVTMTPEFVRALCHRVFLYYHDLMDDIIAIALPVIRRLVWQTLIHEKRDRGERLTTFLDDMRPAMSADIRSRRCL